MDRESFLADPDDIIHAQIPQLVKHHQFIVGVSRFAFVRFNAPDIPEEKRWGSLSEVNFKLFCKML